MATYRVDLEKSNTFLFPTPFVWWTKLGCHQEIKEKYIPLISKDLETNQDYYKQQNSWNCQVTTSFFNEDNYMLHIFDREFLDKVVWDSVDKMLVDINERITLPVPKSSVLSHIWYNKYDNLNWQEIHNHEKSSTYSGIYLISLEENNTTNFVYPQHLRCYTNETLYTLNTSNLDEGHVIIFPSELMHYVNPTLSQNRLTISFNINSDYEQHPINT